MHLLTLRYIARIPKTVSIDCSLYHHWFFAKQLRHYQDHLLCLRTLLQLNKAGLSNSIMGRSPGLKSSISKRIEQCVAGPYLTCTDHQRFPEAPFLRLSSQQTLRKCMNPAEVSPKEHGSSNSCHSLQKCVFQKLFLTFE